LLWFAHVISLPVAVSYDGLIYIDMAGVLALTGSRRIGTSPERHYSLCSLKPLSGFSAAGIGYNDR